MSAAQAERRRMQRCDLEEPVTIKFWDHGPREITGRVLNASPDGVYLETERDLPCHGPLELVFLFPATLRSPGVRFSCECRVIWRRCQGEGKFGLALGILRTESERLARREPQPFWKIPELTLAEP